MAFAALECGTVPTRGSTAALLKRTLLALSDRLDGSLGEVRTKAGALGPIHVFSLATFIADAKSIASLGAAASGCSFAVPPVDRGIGVAGNREHLLAALVNLLQNAFKFTNRHSEVTLHAYGAEERVLIDVKDNCGGLSAGFTHKMFEPFTQAGSDRSGLGLGLSIARRTVEADGGTLTVRDVPGTGCIFTIDLLRHSLP
jgi:signal transduction histidine kinase